MKIVKKIDENWKHHVNHAAVKLNRAISLLFKIRNFVNVNTLKTIYYAIFDSHIDYMVCARKLKTVNRVFTLHKEALRIISFQPIQALCLKSTIYLNLETKFKLKRYSWSVNTSIMYYHQFLTTGTHTVLMYIMVTQIPPLLLNYSNPHSKQSYIEKIYNNTCS